MDPIAMAADTVSVAVFVILLFLAAKAIQAFKKSRQALTESASFISVIVDALSSRVEQSESVVSQVQTELDGLKTRSAGLEFDQASLHTSHLQLLRSLEEILTNDKHLIAELEQFKARLASPHGHSPIEPLAKRADLSSVVGDSNILDSLTSTERQTLEILRREGPKAAPELGKRIRKSREHTSRLMKKLYLEGYVDRESNKAPFRYRLTETVGSMFDASSGSATARASETA